MNAPRNLLSLLRRRAAETGRDRGYSFLGDGEQVTAHVGWDELDAAARVLAARLRACPGSSPCVLLAYPPGLEFIVGLFCCLYAGLVPVPVALPHPRRPSERLMAIAQDCGAELVLTARSGSTSLNAMAEAGMLGSMRVVETGIETHGEAIEAPREPRPGDIAFLQYTSGSTRAPRGVCVTHANVMANLVAIHAAERTGPDSRGVSWLPAFHDMGLVEGLLQPLFGGYPTVLLSHVSFLQRPVRWLQAISRSRATVSGGPNFAYDACLRRVSEAEIEELDLGCWKVAYCGAEPVRAQTLSAFSARFARFGFRNSSVRPVYGLAEATLLVTASDADAGALCTVDADRHGLEAGDLRPARSIADARTLVSCGRPAPGVSVRIVDPDRRRCLPPDSVGEIWVAGESVASGYYGKQASADETFVDATLDGMTARWLRTGDLGCLHEGELYVTGRCKDLVIVRGRKLHPQDIEYSVQRLDPHRIAAAAAFACEGGSDAGEGVAVVVELDARSSARVDGETAWTRLADEIRREVYRDHDVAVASIAVVTAGTLPRTTSGKLMRFRCREAFLQRRLDIVVRFDAAAQTAVRAEIV